jgi:hypothetical protein
MWLGLCTSFHLVALNAPSSFPSACLLHSTQLHSICPLVICCLPQPAHLLPWLPLNLLLPLVHPAAYLLIAVLCLPCCACSLWFLTCHPCSWVAVVKPGFLHSRCPHHFCFVFLLFHSAWFPLATCCSCSLPTWPPLKLQFPPSLCCFPLMGCRYCCEVIVHGSTFLLFCFVFHPACTKCISLQKGENKLRA